MLGRHAESCTELFGKWLGELILYYNPISLINVMVWTASAKQILIFYFPLLFIILMKLEIYRIGGFIQHHWNYANVQSSPLLSAVLVKAQFARGSATRDCPLPLVPIWPSADSDWMSRSLGTLSRTELVCLTLWVWGGAESCVHRRVGQMIGWINITV